MSVLSREGARVTDLDVGQPVHVPPAAFVARDDKARHTLALA
jgi:hypothetical protein